MATDTGAEFTVHVEASETTTGLMRTIYLGSEPQKPVTFRIPAGITSGMKVRLKGVDDTGPGAPKDVYVKVIVHGEQKEPEPAPATHVPPPATPSYNVAPATMRPRRRMPNVLWLALAAVLVFVLVRANSSDDNAQGATTTPETGSSNGVGGGAGSGSGLGVGGGTATPTPTPSPSTQPATAGQYQALLTSVDNHLTPLMRAIAFARTRDAAANAATAAHRVMSSDVDRLAGVSPPDPVIPAHEAYVAALREFAINLQQAGVAARDGQVCAGSSTLARIGRAEGTAHARTAAAELVKLKYTAGTFLPQAAKDQNRRLANGAYVKRGPTNGAGRLTIKNGTGSDVTINLVRGSEKKATTIVYVRQGASFTVGGVRNGGYSAYVAYGADWEPSSKGFTRGCSYEHVLSPMLFQSNASYYSIYTLSLREVNGNALTSPVDPGSFPTG